MAVSSKFVTDAIKCCILNSSLRDGKGHQIQPRSVEHTRHNAVVLRMTLILAGKIPFPKISPSKYKPPKIVTQKTLR